MAITALRLAYGDRSAGAHDDAREWTAAAFGLPGGELLVWIAAASVTGYGLYPLYRSYAPKLGRQLDLSQLRDPALGWVVNRPMASEVPIVLQLPFTAAPARQPRDPSSP